MEPIRNRTFDELKVGDSLTATLTVARLDPDQRKAMLDCAVTDQEGQLVLSGTAEVVEPREKAAQPGAAPPVAQPGVAPPVAQPGAAPPQERLREPGSRHRDLLAAAQAAPRVRTAVVHPVDTVSLLGAVEAARAGLIEPVLVGPEAKIRQAAAQAHVDLTPFRLVPTAHSHAAADAAVALARAGEVAALMKGALHTDELMHAVVARDTGLRTGRRISHVFAMDVPTYPRPLLITDAAINIYPTLEDKRDIVQNAIDLAHALGIVAPRVAILSALETVYPKIASTIEAAALCKMAERGQITGAVVDGPMAFDLAVSDEAARTKGFVSPVAGRADILVVPDLEAGNMLAKQLEYLGQAQVAGIVLGARVPIMLPSRADGPLARRASCALAALLVQKSGAPAVIGTP